MAGKFAVFSGFLGSGKTSTMMALTKYHSLHHGRAAMISNDLGGQGLADHHLARLAGCHASELTDECICYQTENLIKRLNELFDEEGCALVISDIPGFGVGALEHVYHTLAEKYPGAYELAPFTVLTEPRVVARLRSGAGGDLEYILRTQLEEADLIVLNKCDLLTKAEQREAADYLNAAFPHADTVCISALCGEGLEELSRRLTEGRASMRRPDIGYGGAAFSAAMGKMSEYYIQYHAAVCCNDFDGNAYLREIAEQVRAGMRSGGWEIPHLKLLAWEAEGDYGKLDLLGVEHPPETVHSFVKPCTEAAVVLNASAACPYEKLDEIITGAAEEISRQYQLELMIFKKECFGMGGGE